MTKTKKFFSILKTLLISALIFSAGYIAFAVPKAAETFMPVVKTISLEPCEYSPFVTAKGSIIKKGEQFFAVAAVNEADISEVKTGQRVILSGAAFPDGSYSGTVSSISDAAYTSALNSAYAPETVVDVVILINEGNVSDLREGYSVTAQVITGEKKTLNMLPYSAICQDDKGEYVYILNKDTAQRRDIVTGMELSDKTEIISGVNPSDKILSAPESVYDGGKVRVSGEG